MTTTDPTAPATPGEALRWAAERITARLVAAGGSASANAAVAWLNVWARDLDAARATDPVPASPPEHQPGAQTYELPAEPPPGLFRKFRVERVDGRDQPGGDKAGARYFVLDYIHDPYAVAALAAYAAACERELPDLAADLRALPLSTTPPAGTEPASATAVDLPAGTVWP